MRRDGLALGRQGGTRKDDNNFKRSLAVLTIMLRLNKQYTINEITMTGRRARAPLRTVVLCRLVGCVWEF